MARHKWNAPKLGVADTTNNGGYAVQCVKCGCIREYVGGYPTYFIDDTVHDKYTPKCDERLIKPNHLNKNQ